MRNAAPFFLLLDNRNAGFFLKIAMLCSSSQAQCCFLLHNHNAAFFFITISMLFISSQ